MDWFQFHTFVICMQTYYYKYTLLYVSKNKIGKAVLQEKLRGAQFSELVKSSVPSI